MDEGVQLVADKLANRQLSTRDKRLKYGLQDNLRGVEREELHDELTPQNLNLLAWEITRAKDPQTKAILMQEFERLKSLAGNLMFPVQRPPQPAGMIDDSLQKLPFEVPSRPMPRFSDIPAGVDPSRIARPAADFWVK